MLLSNAQMQNILSKQVQDLYAKNSNLVDCINSDFDTSNVEDGIITYSVIGFEVSLFVDLGVAESTGNYNKSIQLELDQIDNECLEDEYIDYSVSVITERKKPVIQANVAYNGVTTILEELVDCSSEDAFMAQCQRMIMVL